MFDDGTLALRPAEPDAALQALAERLQRRYGGRLHLGTSSWHFPGWAGQVWRDAVPEALLSRQGLAAYAAHPLLSTVSLDRAFYRLLGEAEYARLAAQVPAAFRFVVKAPAVLTDAQRRDAANGQPLADNPGFLDPALALGAVLPPLVQGLAARLGVLVLQLSPLPRVLLNDAPALHARLAALFESLVPGLPTGALLALELRDAGLLTPALAALLRQHGVRPVLGLHDRMPEAEAQLPLLRAAWPGDFVCRWNLQRGLRYAEAYERWAPFERLRAPDPATRSVIARVAHATLEAGHRVFVTINNKAEGSAPASVLALAQAIDALAG